MSADNPVRKAYELYCGDSSGSFAHSSWDLTAVQYAVQGSSVFWGEEKGYMLFSKDSDIEIEDSRKNGYNGWKSDVWGKDAYLQSRWPEEEIARVLDEQILRSEQ